MGLLDELRDAKLSAKTHEAICQSLIEENKKYRAVLEEIVDSYDNDYVGERCLARIAANALIKES